MKFPRLLLIVAAGCGFLAGCGGVSNHPISITPDFSVSVPSSQAWSGGSSGSAVYTVQVSPRGGFTGAVDLAVSGLHSGVNASFNPSSINTSGTSTLTLNGTLPPHGSYPFTITGTSGSLAHNVSATLFVPGPVSTNVLIPPGALNGADGSLVQQYLMNNPNAPVRGGTFQVEWSAIDNGSGYDWSYSDALYTAFAGVGKNVNFVFWANADSSSNNCSQDGKNGDTNAGNCAIPTYVWNDLGASNYTTCTPSNTNGPQRIPNYFAAAFQTNYQKFITAAVQHYGDGSFPKVGYIRFGLGHGGETIPVGDWDSGDACSQQFTAWGLTIQTWTTYLTDMLTYEANVTSTVPVQLMVGITPMGNPSTQVPEAVATAAVPLGIGFGSQGLEKSDITNYPNCTADWCNLFNAYAGKVAACPTTLGNCLELQTMAQSCSNNSCTTGSLTTLLPFAVLHNVTILEIYYQDWLTGYDASYSGYTQSYATVLQNTATGQ